MLDESEVAELIEDLAISLKEMLAKHGVFVMCADCRRLYPKDNAICYCQKHR